jgi:hypothetical protein
MIHIGGSHVLLIGNVLSSERSTRSSSHNVEGYLRIGNLINRVYLRIQINLQGLLLYSTERYHECGPGK